jgi:hypothetical protein
LTLEIGPSRIRLRDVDAHTVLDTDERLFHQTDYLSGTIAIQSRSSVITGNVDVARTIVLGSCSADATHVIGAFQVEFPGASNPSGVPGFGWFNIGGSYLHWYDASSMTASGWANNPLLKARLSAFCVYTYRVNSGQVLLDEWVRIAGYVTAGIGTYYTMNAFKMHYRLRAGLFT